MAKKFLLYRIDFSKYRLITNLGILCLWSLRKVTATRLRTTVQFHWLPYAVNWLSISFTVMQCKTWRIYEFLLTLSMGFVSVVLVRLSWSLPWMILAGVLIIQNKWTPSSLISARPSTRSPIDTCFTSWIMIITVSINKSINQWIVSLLTGRMQLASWRARLHIPLLWHQVSPGYHTGAIAVFGIQWPSWMGFQAVYSMSICWW